MRSDVLHAKAQMWSLAKLAKKFDDFVDSIKKFRCELNNEIGREVGQ